MLLRFLTRVPPTAAKFAGTSLQSIHRYSSEEMRIATDDFDESNRLGEGGSAIVYKGQLGGTQTVAIKRFKVLPPLPSLFFAPSTLLIIDSLLFLSLQWQPSQPHHHHMLTRPPPHIPPLFSSRKRASDPQRWQSFWAKSTSCRVWCTATSSPSSDCAWSRGR